MAPQPAALPPQAKPVVLEATHLVASGLPTVTVSTGWEPLLYTVNDTVTLALLARIVDGDTVTA